MTALTPLHDLAPLIEAEGRGKPWFTYAKPYVDALYSLRTTADSYGYDSGTSVVSYALANLGSWRGETARSVKIELNRHLKK